MEQNQQGWPGPGGPVPRWAVHRRPFSRRRALQLGGGALGALALPGTLAACGGATARGANVLQVSQSEDAKTLDPHKQGDMLSMNVLVNIFDTLTTHDADDEIAPRLALSWEPVSERTWRFTLRPDVTFHNGEPCDAAAVRFSVERLLDPDTASPIVELRYVDGVEVVDPLTVDLHTTQHDPILPAKLALFGGVVVPPRYLAEVGDDGFAREPVGTGPFRFARWRRDHELRLTAHQDHWAGPPGVTELVFRPLPNPSSALAALQSDEVDLVTGLSPDAAQQLEGYGGVELESRPGIRTAYLSLDTEDGPLRDPRVRRAMNHAVDVPQLVDAVLNGRAREVPAMIPDGAFGFDASLAPFTRDTALARELLADAGHPDGIDTTLTASNDDAHVAEAISGLLAQAGIRARVELLDPGTYSSRLTSDNRRALGPVYLAASTVWTLDGASMLQSNVRSDRRQSRWTSAEADQLVDTGELSVDPAERRRAFGDLQRLIQREAPFVPLYQLDTIVAHNGRPDWTPGITGALRMETAEVRG